MCGCRRCGRTLAFLNTRVKCVRAKIPSYVALTLSWLYNIQTFVLISACVFLFCRPYADDSGVGLTEVRQK